MYPALVHELAKLLEETEERPLTQIAAVIEVLGEQAVLKLLAETQRVEDAGGMLAAGGSRRRSRGGVFFALARRRLGKKDRVAIFGWRKPREDDHAACVAPPVVPGGSGDNGHGEDRSDGGHGGAQGGGDDLPQVEPNPSTPEVQSAAEEATPNPDQQPAEAPTSSTNATDPTNPTNLVDLMTPTNPTSKDGETMDETPAASSPVAHGEMARAMARTSARRAVACAIADLEPIDQRLVLLDTLAELEQEGEREHVQAASVHPEVGNQRRGPRRA